MMLLSSSHMAILKLRVMYDESTLFLHFYCLKPNTILAARVHIYIK